MAKATKTNATSVEVVDSPTIITRPNCKGLGYALHPTICVEVECQSTQVIERPAVRIGVQLALQQVDGVDGAVNGLFKGQYDEKFGDYDPACDIHTDPLLLKANMLKSGYDQVMNSRESE